MNNHERRKNISWHAAAVTHEQRCQLNQQSPSVLWLTGLSGSGKSTIAYAADKLFWEKGYRSYVLDGDNLRHGLCNNLGFSEEERSENSRRVAEVAKLFVDSGVFVLVALISPTVADRARARQIISPHRFVEVFVDAPLSVCESRDPKGLYSKARSGEITQFTGIDAPYEVPTLAEVCLQTNNKSVTCCARQLVDYLGLDSPAKA